MLSREFTLYRLNPYLQPTSWYMITMMTWIQSWWKWWLEYENGERGWHCKCCSFHQFQLQAVRLSFLAFLRQGPASSPAFLHKFLFFSCLWNIRIGFENISGFWCPEYILPQVFIGHQKPRYSSNHLHCQLVRPCQQHLRGAHGATWPGEHLHHLWSRQRCVHTSKEEGEQS